ncbi:hypothetical protein [Micromonospora profundi]|uniref:hypothetical protein n=1 Tax=Micromonospora profundi TaxID=1420889 RepID=UPI0036CAB4FA
MKPTIRRDESRRKKAPKNNDVSPRGLALLVAAAFAGYVVMEYPQAATPALVVVGVLTVLNQFVGRR